MITLLRHSFLSSFPPKFITLAASLALSFLLESVYLRYALAKTGETSCSGRPSELLLEFSSASTCSTQLLVDSDRLAVVEGAEVFSFSFFLKGWCTVPKSVHASFEAVPGVSVLCWKPVRHGDYALACHHDQEGSISFRQDCS